MEFNYRAMDKRASTHIPSSSSTTQPRQPLPFNAYNTLLTANMALNNNNDIALARQRLQLEEQEMRRAEMMMMIDQKERQRLMKMMNDMRERQRKMTMMMEQREREISYMKQLQNTLEVGFFDKFYNCMGMAKNKLLPSLTVNQQQQKQQRSPSVLSGNVAAIQILTTQPVTQPLSEDIKEPLVDFAMNKFPFLIMYQQQKQLRSPTEILSNLLAIQRPTRPVMKPLSDNIKESIVEDKVVLSFKEYAEIIDEVLVYNCVDFDVAEKRKAETPVVADGNDPNEAPSHSTGKKRRIEWSCSLCQVINISKQNLDRHLKGKKHKDKVAVSNASKSSSLEEESNNDERKVNLALLNASKTSIESDNDEGKAEEALNASKTPKESNNDEFPVEGSHKHNKFWCQMCRVGTTTEALMKEHRNGNEHMNLQRK
ncbi:hypothetical protein SO802_003613 [Lithocarpus litseifolius]|uniref:C2H2-type domain-containing protein n=1 Tax=Lithocarpus litseifolius TaxID=425828 RepID=A0AAW2E2J3_9ROSI